MRSRSFVTVRDKARWPSCPRCGSTLAGGRIEERRAGLEIFRCRCGRGRHVRREVAAA